MLIDRQTKSCINLFACRSLSPRTVSTWMLAPSCSTSMTMTTTRESRDSSNHVVPHHQRKISVTGAPRDCLPAGDCNCKSRIVVFLCGYFFEVKSLVPGKMWWIEFVTTPRPRRLQTHLFILKVCSYIQWINIRKLPFPCALVLVQIVFVTYVGTHW